MGLFAEFHSPVDTLVLVVEDAAKATYAYLWDGRKIVADVWLWNLRSPAKDEWDDRTNLPVRKLARIHERRAAAHSRRKGHVMRLVH
jgi:hypothetical protein